MTRPRRRWPSMRLRGSMLLILVLGLLMGWPVRRASVQRRAIAAVQRLGGEVGFDWQYHENVDPPSPRLKWLRDRIGDEYFQEVVRVDIPTKLHRPPEPGEGPGALERWNREQQAYHDLYIKPIEDDQLACLDGLDRLDFLILQKGPWKAQAIDRLQRLASLKYLAVFTNLDADVMSRIGELTNLETLIFMADWEEGRSFAFLDRLTHLKFLALTTGPLSDEDFDRIGRLRTLERLCINGEVTTDARLARLKNLTAMKFLELPTASKITEVGLAHLDGMTNLEDLDLGGSSLSVEAQNHLIAHHKLKNLVYDHDARPGLEW